MEEKRSYVHKGGRSGIGKKMMEQLSGRRGQLVAHAEEAAEAAKEAKMEFSEGNLEGAAHLEALAMHNDRVVKDMAKKSRTKKAAAKAVEAEEKAFHKVQGLMGGELEGGKLEGGKLEGGELEGGKLEGGKLEGGRRRHHHRMMMGGSTESKLEGGELEGGKLEGGDLEGGKLEGGKLEGGKLEGGKLEGGKLEGGKLEGGRRRHHHRMMMGGSTESKLEGGELEGGKLEGGDLEGGGRRKAEHTRADARGLLSKAKIAAKHAEYDAVHEETGVLVGHTERHRKYKSTAARRRSRSRSAERKEERAEERRESPKRELPAKLRLWTKLVHEVTGSRAVLRKDNPLYAEVRARYDREV